jgi:hypothetical protein
MATKQFRDVEPGEYIYYIKPSLTHPVVEALLVKSISVFNSAYLRLVYYKSSQLVTNETKDIVPTGEFYVPSHNSRCIVYGNPPTMYFADKSDADEFIRKA